MNTTLVPDCTRCTALCCVTLAFDRSEFFSFDKPAGEACRNLQQHQCGIHSNLEREGHAGCVRYDCLGAGQRVTAMFDGRSWRDHPELAPVMFEAFRVMRQLQELALLLTTAERLPLAPAQEQRRVELLGTLHPVEGWSPGSLAAFERGRTTAEVQAFLASLRDCVPASWAPRRRLAVVA